jgi:leucyl aminopeptidase
MPMTELELMQRVFCQRASARSVPLWALTHAEFGSWLAGQPLRISEWVRQTRFESRPGEQLQVRSAEGRLEQVILVLNDPPGLWDLATAATTLPAHDYVLQPQRPDDQRAALLLGFALGSYRYDRYRTREQVARAARRPRLLLPEGVQDQVIRAALATLAVRDLVNTPASDMGPDELEALGRTLARRYSGACRVIRGADLLKANYPMIHAVGRASTRAPRLIDLRWGSARAPKVTIVGKGVCFDSGGLSIKSFDEMLTMKIDMSGAAHAYALAQMVLAAALPVRLRVLVPAVENAIAGNAYRPLDILTSRKGLTVEIGSTDAEGRLILADALCDADAEGPEVLIDFGTLTSFEAGAGLMAAFFTHDEAAASELSRLSAHLEDPLWRMPITPLLKDRLKGKLADLTNTGSIYKGSTLRCALFLSNFVEAARTWIHIDLPDGNDEDRPGRPVGAEAFGLRAVFAYLEQRFGTASKRKRGG